MPISPLFQPGAPGSKSQSPVVLEKAGGREMTEVRVTAPGPETPLYLYTSLDHGQGHTHPPRAEWDPSMGTSSLPMAHKEPQPQRSKRTCSNPFFFFLKNHLSDPKCFCCPSARGGAMAWGWHGRGSAGGSQGSSPSAASASRLIKSHLQALSHPGSLPQAQGQAQPPRRAGSRQPRTEPDGSSTGSNVN